MLNGETMNLTQDLPEWSAQGPVAELAEHTCWDLIRGTGVGRLGVSTRDAPEIFPVNYYCEPGTLLFRTADGTKLRDLIANKRVVFEIDSLGLTVNWSVTMKGAAIVKDATYANRRAEDSLPAWTPVSVYRFVEIIPDSISGRRFDRHLSPARITQGHKITIRADHD